MKPKNEKRVKELLDRAETAISSKYKTKEELENAYARVLVMSQQFDKALNYMRNAALDYADGDISKGELYAVLREQKKIIKEPCQLLMIHLGQDFHKEDEIDMDDTIVFRTGGQQEDDTHHRLPEIPFPVPQQRAFPLAFQAGAIHIHFRIDSSSVLIEKGPALRQALSH